MSGRKVPLVGNEVYHIYSKSIAGYEIFATNEDYHRMVAELGFYSLETPPCKFSLFQEINEHPITTFSQQFASSSKKIVDIIAYCLMPTHIHLILKGLTQNGISKFVGSILQSYSQYFNKRHNRKGPLWEGRFSNVLVENDSQFLHLSRYIHLNPVTAYLVNDPKNWEHSSYKEYLGLVDEKNRICKFSEYLDVSTISYENFVNDHIDHQRKLASIKSLTLD